MSRRTRRRAPAPHRSVVVSRLNPDPHAGYKARDDVALLVARQGFARVDLPDFGGGDTSKGRAALRSALRIVANIPRLLRSDLVLVQYPLGRINDLLMSILARRAISVALVHDLESLRETEFAAREAENLARFDAVILHSEAMQAYVRQIAPSARSVVLGPFDYLVDEQLPAVSARPERIYVIGHLRPDKIGYLRDAGDLALPVTLYGPGIAEDDVELRSRWGGVLAPHSPRLEQRDGFGLVWDGPSASGLAGSFGGYQRYNSPHKFSLYLALGIPVIVSDESALAPFVREHGIGLTVSTIAEGAQAAADCTAQEWTAFVAAVARVRDSVVDGGRTRQAIKRATAVALLDA